MFQSLKTTSKVFKNAIFAMFLFGTSNVFASTVELCESTIPVGLDSAVESFGYEGETQVFEVEVDEPGYLMIEAALPLARAARPKLGFLGRLCDGTIEAKAGFRTTGRLISASVIELNTAGTYWFRVAAQDPRQALNDYRVHVAFMSHDELHNQSGTDDGSSVPVNLSSVPVNLSGTDDGSSVPVNLSGTDDGSSVPVNLSTTGSSVPVNLSTTGSSVPVNLSSVPVNLLRAAAGCSEGTDDEHADSLLCATFVGMGDALISEIRHGGLEDVDTVSFMVSTPQTITIETLGDLDMTGELYDGFGHRLEVAHEGGEGSNLRLSRTLSPGRYFVKLSASDSGSYGLIVEASSW